jgi:lipid A ethanolaminephosphotransferase
MVVVLVIGESARAENFSLYGYKRNTNPNLKKVKNLVVLKAQSLATYTTASVHSMLSYKGSTSDNYEVLPNYLHRLGVYVIWRKHNWGAPTLHVDKVESLSDLKKFCKEKNCNYDEELLTDLDKEILSANKNKVFVILHTAGSHGPTYYKKYPKKFEIFKPVCKTVDLKECTHQELINAYDDTILYTDYFLFKTIQTLKKIKDRPVVMIYLSDHGESLGEYGLYLHGTPYYIAPKYQKDIPFLIWMSDMFLKQKNFKIEKINKNKIYSTKNVFHTVLGAFDINNSIYNKNLDILNVKDNE